MRGVVVIEFWKKLGRNWCFVVYSGGRQPKLGLKRMYTFWQGEPRLETLLTCSRVPVSDVSYVT